MPVSKRALDFPNITLLIESAKALCLSGNAGSFAALNAIYSTAERLGKDAEDGDFNSIHLVYAQKQFRVQVTANRDKEDSSRDLNVELIEINQDRKIFLGGLSASLGFGENQWIVNACHLSSEEVSSLAFFEHLAILDSLELILKEVSDRISIAQVIKDEMV